MTPAKRHKKAENKRKTISSEPARHDNTHAQYTVRLFSSLT